MTETVSTAELDIGTEFKLPDSHPRNDAGEWVTIIDYTRPNDYGSSVYAYEYESGEYGGLFVTDSEHSDEVEVR